MLVSEVKDFSSKIKAKKISLNSLIENDKSLIENYTNNITKNSELINRQQSLQKLINTYTTSLISFYTKEVSTFINKVLKNIISDYPHTIILKEYTSGSTNKTLIGIYKQINNNPESLQNVVKSSGGGICAIISQILLIYFHLRFRKTNDSYIFLDEQLSQLSLTYQPAMSQFLKYVSRQYKININLVTHSPSLTKYSDNVFETKDGYVNEILLNDINYSEEVNLDEVSE